MSDVQYYQYLRAFISVNSTVFKWTHIKIKPKGMLIDAVCDFLVTHVFRQHKTFSPEVNACSKWIITIFFLHKKEYHIILMLHDKILEKLPFLIFANKILIWFWFIFQESTCPRTSEMFIQNKGAYCVPNI